MPLGSAERRLNPHSPHQHRPHQHRPAAVSRSRRLVAASAAGALALGGLAAGGLASAAPATAQDPAGAETISSDVLSVQVSTAFPQALKYTQSATGKSLTGATSVASSLTINGTDQPVQVTATESDPKTMSYVLTPGNLSGVSLEAKLAVDGSVVTFSVTKITDTAQNRVNNLQIKNQDLVTVSSTEPGATVASAVISVDRAVSGDTITPITAGTPVDAAAKKANLSLASTDQLAAAFDTNSLYDSNSPNASSEGGRFWRQAVSDAAGGVKMGVSSGAWLYRAAGSSQTEELPWSRVVIGADANADGTVDWQDAAIAYRSIERKPLGSADVKNRVITHIPFNFASQATNPFLRTLDNVKRIAAATDGLGQMALLKGYTSEGHDSANSDFGGNYNERAGGLADMNSLLKDGAAYGATFGVHINATEVYPEANSFNENITRQPLQRNWNWLDQAYFINQNWDIGSGSLENRVKQLRSEAGPNLTMTYVDTYYTPGWAAYRTQKALNDSGFSVTSEWSNSLATNTTWSHWSADENYGGSGNKGINSQILRFVGNSTKDTWNPDPRLGNAQVKEFEGWTGQNDYNAFSKNIWTTNLPTKFLQQQEITKWTPDRIDFTGGLSVTGSNAGNRVISQDGKTVLNGSNYLLPWSADPAQFGPGAANDPGQEKLYHYSANGGTSTWQLTGDFAKASSLTMYRLTDNGRESPLVVPVVNGSVSLVALPNQPYVLVPVPATTTVPAANYGAGTPFQDPGFNAGNLQAWNPTGGASIERMDKGQLVAKLGPLGSSISQQLAPLQAGTYSVSAWVEIQPGQKRPTTLSVTGVGAAPASVTVDQSGARNQVGADEKRDSYFQRLRVLIDAKAGDTPQLAISAPPGAASVRIDDVRAVRTERVPSTGVLSEDFENTDQGWGPFVKGDAGGVNDPRTHIAKRNEPYTQAGWNNKTTSDVLGGDFSLHSHQENAGLVYRTSNYTVPMQPGRQYKVSFDYQASEAGTYQWVSGYDNTGRTVQTSATPIGVATQTTRWTQTINASSCGASWVGLRNVNAGKGEFSLDNLLVEDLGPSTETPACASLAVVSGQDVIEPGAVNRFTSTFTSTESAPISNLAVSLGLPEGWKATAKTPATAATLPANGSLRTDWEVEVPASSEGDFTVTSKADYRTTADPIGDRTTTAQVDVNTLPAPPNKDTYASDMKWIGTPANGWGPVERDQANGEQGQGDGPPLTLGGKVYTKGLGAHAASNIRYYVGSQCSAFTAVIGIDDIQKPRGQAVFSVVGDGSTLYTSPVMKGGAAPATISVPLNGAKYVELKADVVGGNNGNAWADWADAKFLCSAPVAPLNLQPELSVDPSTLLPGTGLTVRVADLAPGSELKTELRSDPVDLGSATAGPDGVASLPVTIPLGTAVGEHRIVVSGTDKNGLAATGARSVKVIAAPTGSDAAGTSNTAGNSSGSSNGTSGAGANGAGTNGIGNSDAGTNGAGTAGSNGNTVAEIKSGADPAGGELALTGVGAWLAPLGVALLLVLSGVAALAVRQHRGRP
ncbi:endo-alpha-N-acetylgalactosaminidase family protein [Arthrobacter russicus]|uniref:Endo-alpha-N-acetylgalactosaminidase n=1 Tax=Arthrobacter russicus TaxID=172040 RepID=A0ABU1J9T0_9MICC|nr:endo-alpha-N-acetylgalactosaminidase family protein [Arthrobacter russicus]MDR6268636.1 endo-alpha-N-acetylgalactosaminidase [Arthrobacter russicus]